MKIPKYVTEEFLRANPDVVFVFGDNLVRKGKGGAAKLRDEPNTYGFVTKRYPNNEDGSFYRPLEYVQLFYSELMLLSAEISNHPERTYLISKLGAGLANKYLIYDKVIEPVLKNLGLLGNVIIL